MAGSHDTISGHGRNSLFVANRRRTATDVRPPGSGSGTTRGSRQANPAPLDFARSVTPAHGYRLPVSRSRWPPVARLRRWRKPSMPNWLNQVRTGPATAPRPASSSVAPSQQWPDNVILLPPHPQRPGVLCRGEGGRPEVVFWATSRQFMILRTRRSHRSAQPGESLVGNSACGAHGGSRHQRRGSRESDRCGAPQRAAGDNRSDGATNRRPYRDAWLARPNATIAGHLTLGTASFTTASRPTRPACGAAGTGESARLSAATTSSSGAVRCRCVVAPPLDVDEFR